MNYESNSDAHNIVQIEPSGKQILNLFKNLIGNEKIEYLNSHGTATTTNDEIEAKVIIEYFGDAKNCQHGRSSSYSNLSTQSEWTNC